MPMPKAKKKEYYAALNERWFNEVDPAVMTLDRATKNSKEWASGPYRVAKITIELVQEDQ